MLEKQFHLKERGTTVRTEFFAGLTTFMAMAYILMVNAAMFSDPFGNGTDMLGVSYGAIYIATALSAIIGTVLVGLLSNLPLAQASGMGLNAYFVYTVCIAMGLTYANGLVLVLADGLIFLVLTTTGLRKKIFEAIPKAVKDGIPAGIGLFIAFIGLQSSGLVTGDSATLVKLGSFNVYNGGMTWGTIMPMLVTVGAVISIAIFAQKGKKGGILWGILGSSVAYYVLGFTVTGFYDGFGDNLMMNPLTAFSDFFTLSLGKVFTQGFDFTPFIEANGMGGFVLVFATTALSFCMVDMFDTLGTLYGACTRGGLLNEQGEIPKMNQAMLADAIATTSGAVLGTSTVTTFVESSAGVAEGGRTGLSSMFTALCFFIAMFLAPVAQLIPSYATAGALIYVGVLMMRCVLDVDWDSPAVAVPAFFTIAMMSFTYNISFGIAFGILSWIAISLFTGERKNINVTTVVIGLLFALTLFLTH